MDTETDQAARDAAVKAAFAAWDKERTFVDDEGVHRPKPKDEIDALWEAMWRAADFSWAGLADAGWERGTYEANEAQRLKRWRAPADFPGDGRVHGEGDTAWRQSNLQEYWRWSRFAPGFAGEDRLLSDEELTRAGLLIEAEGVLWHVLHRPGLRASVAL
ncbi:MAG: hypothetical protein AAFR16_12115, partial [Pseudomonadota bacterium]